MPDRAAQLATRYVRTHEAARLLGLSPRTLEKYRCHGSGPTFRKLGGRVVYAVDDLDAWADKSACSSTSAIFISRPMLRAMARLRTSKSCSRSFCS